MLSSGHLLELFPHIVRMDFISAIRTCYRLILLLLILTAGSCVPHSWERPGCHRVGLTIEKQIHPDCLVFNVTYNACRGFCKSQAYPSPIQTLLANENHFITSRAECCRITETEDVKVKVKCIQGIREVTFKSAKSCACSTCQNSFNG
ncbi:hypothetical protein CHS0354_029086 [Potamilus streckersoni]|uniref:Glycoprotein hormone alpha-2 n=1 Tax=Potamilus streckersoni TaxID=2493646 RepID=A0AAE0SXJ7_9BIVA|nr:hypothetical protein CHS0354_029086 [Potamilus streckersoni]